MLRGYKGAEDEPRTQDYKSLMLLALLEPKNLKDYIQSRHTTLLVCVHYLRFRRDLLTCQRTSTMLPCLT
jgi:hypothetical protein